MSSIKITFPDNSVKEFDAGVTTAEIAKSISISLAKKAVAGKVAEKTGAGWHLSVRVGAGEGVGFLQRL